MNSRHDGPTRDALYQQLRARLGPGPDALPGLHWVARGQPGGPLSLGVGAGPLAPALQRLMAGQRTDRHAVPLRSTAGAAPSCAQGWVTASNASHPLQGHGTLGAVLQSPYEPRRLYALTAGHALAGAPGSQTGDDCVLQQHDPTLQLVGRLAAWAPEFSGDTAAGTMDAALMEIDGSALPALADHLAWPSGVARVAAGDAVRLLTRHHQLPGRVVDDHFSTTTTSGAAGTYVLHDLLLCQVDAGTQGGDSGAPVWNEQGQLVGLHIAQVAPGAGGNAAVMPIGRVLDWTGCQVVLAAAPPAPGMQPAQAAAGGAPAALAAPAPAVSAASLDVLARTLWGEARGEGEAGMGAVGHVVLNRVARPCWWGRSVEQVCLKPWQFSCWNDNDPNLGALRRATLGDPTFAAATRQATALLAMPGAVRAGADPTGGATHYHAIEIRAPAWTQGATFTTQIGRHRFFRNVP